MALFNNSADAAESASTSSSNASTNNGTSDSTASIEGESAPEPDIPRLNVASHDQEQAVSSKNNANSDLGAQDVNVDEVRLEGNDDGAHYRSDTPLASSTITLTPLGAGSRYSAFGNPAIDASLRIPREPAYGNDAADGEDDGNQEDIEDGDEYDEADDLYDQLFDFQDPMSRKAALATASALFAQQVGSSSTSGNGGEDEMDEIEKSFLRSTKPICSKKELVSCLSSRSTSPGPISPLLSDEDFPSLCSATSGSSSTAPSSRRSSDGSHTPRVRFKKGCVITAVNFTWAPTTYDRAPIDVAESLDMHRFTNVEDAEGYAQDDDSAPAIHEQVAIALDFAEPPRGEWQAFPPAIYNPDDLPSTISVTVLPRAPPSPPAASSPAPLSEAKYAYASTFGQDDRRPASPEESPSSSDYQSGFSFARSAVGYPLSRQSCFESTSSSSSSSDSECDDIIERCRGLRDLQYHPGQAQSRQLPQQTPIYRPTARSSVRHSLVSSTATVETSLGAAARELSDSLDESSRSASPSLSQAASDNEDCLSSTPRPGFASFMSRRSEYLSSSSTVRGFGSSCAARQADFEANGTHDTSPPPQEEQPARKVQRRLGRRTSSSCSVNRFASSGDIWESCEALGGF